MKAPSKRCAVYTRKSSEEGLEQEFNSLHAQRDACIAYISSQKSEGWVASKISYDDGGFSGGTMGRPALQQLIEDIKARKIDIVVVYKIDRLTRSLMDFSKLVEVFDEYGVTFVSVTQSFNTTTSMGRLTLNVLLSFAQFEREVTGERIRDKIAASKKKGMWMGGTIPLGYDVEGRRLVVNKIEAGLVRMIYDKYLELGSVSGLKHSIDSAGVRTKVNMKEGGVRGGRPYSRGNLYLTLTNPLYVGMVRHKAEAYDGQHEAIIDRDLWDKVQLRLKQGSVKPPGHDYTRVDKLLTGKLFDCDGNRYTPSTTNKGDRKYRYYVSQNLLQPRNHPNNVIARIPAVQIEKVITQTIRSCLQLPEKLAVLTTTHDDARLKYITNNIDDDVVRQAIKGCLKKIVINLAHLELYLSRVAVKKLLADRFKIEFSVDENDSYVESIPFHTRRGDRVNIICAPVGAKRDPFDKSPTELKNWVRGIVWRDEFHDGVKIQDIAAREKLSPRYVGRLIDASLNP